VPSDAALSVVSLHLIPGQELVRSLDSSHLACITDGKWKTGYHPSQQLIDGILKWRLDRTLIQDALPFLSPDEREFLMTGITPAQWQAMFPEPTTPADPY
jgi:hypothetical protein